MKVRFDHFEIDTVDHWASVALPSNDVIAYTVSAEHDGDVYEMVVKRSGVTFKKNGEPVER